MQRAVQPLRELGQTCALCCVLNCVYKVTGPSCAPLQLWLGRPAPCAPSCGLDPAHQRLGVFSDRSTARTQPDAPRAAAAAATCRRTTLWAGAAMRRLKAVFFGKFWMLPVFSNLL